MVNDLGSVILAPDFHAILPLPPSANRMWRKGNGKTYLAPDYEVWLRTVATEVLVLGGAGAIPGRYALRIVLPEQRKDPDNLIKPTQDGLAKAGVIADDRHLRRMILEVDATHPAGLMTVDLWAMETPAKKRKSKAA